jgi:HSP20 family molecular chaperone IbpA
MPFFYPQADITPELSLIQLLSELDQPQQKTCVRRVAPKPQTFTPNFDVAEVPQAYELYGELPGLEQSDLSIEFSDAQTLVIKGKTQRPEATPLSQPEPSSPISDTASEKSLNPTVEDEYDAADAPLSSTTEKAEPEKKEQQAEVAPKPQAKFWVKERKVGEFARSFAFSQRVDHDGVVASLKNGILHVTVPKSTKNRKVVINVV